MNIEELRKQLQKIKTKIDTFQEKRVEGAYLDLLVLGALSEELTKQVMDEDIFEIRGQEKFRAVTNRYYQLAAILKAAHMFANIFYEVLLSEATNKPRLVVNALLNNPDPMLKGISTKKLLPAYCVVAYRHKVIAHQDLRRMNSFYVPHRANEMRLIPFPGEFHIEERNVKAIEELKKSYQDEIVELQDEDNVYNLLRILFYRIPIGELGNMNQDRRKIDKILEAGGCRSMTANEIIAATDEFVAAVVDAV
jgi:hypothetical protein